VKKLDDKLNHLFSRRSFLAGAGTTAAAVMVAGCSDNNSATPPITTTSSTFTDADVLNFALNLEYLEASFYLYAANGSGLAAADMAAPSGYGGAYAQGTIKTSGNIPVTSVASGSGGALTAAQQNIINEIAYEEQSHVRFLRSALGSAAVPCPALDLTFFSTLANVTPGIGTPVTGATAFSPFTSFNNFLIGAFIFEDVGVTAYSGAAPLISTTTTGKTYLTAAAGILAVEAYHAGYVRTAITGISIATNSNALISLANNVAALRASLTVGNSTAPSMAGSVETALKLPTSFSTPSAIVAADPTKAVGFSRTVNQVHHIVYGSPTVGVKSGGFFPSGTNSIFATTTA
jgi:hypothetical protein